MSNQKAQSWSVDIILAVIVFMIAFFIFYAMLESNPETKVSDLKEEASIVIGQVGDDESPLKAVDNGAIDVNEWNKLQAYNYDDLKRKLRTGGDFCIYIEDERGNIVQIDPDDTSSISIGSPAIKIKDTPCSPP